MKKGLCDGFSTEVCGERADGERGKPSLRAHPSYKVLHKLEESGGNTLFETLTPDSRQVF